MTSATKSKVHEMSKTSKGDAEQVQRFIEAARELGCDDSEERFAEVVRTVAKAPVPSAAEMKVEARAARKPKAKPSH